MSPHSATATLNAANACHQEAVAAVAASKLLIYAMNYSPEVTGCGRYTGEIGAAMAHHGVKVEVVTTAPHYPGWRGRDGYDTGKYIVESTNNVRITRCPLWLHSDMRGFWRAMAPISFAVCSAPAVFWRILKFRPDTVYCVEPTLFAAPVALLAARLVGAKTVLHVQDLEIDAAFAVGHVKNGFLKSISRWFDRTVTRGFDHVVTISNMMAARLRDKGVKPDRLSIIRNWVDTSKIFPMDKPSPYRAELGIRDDQRVVLYAGNIGPKQALHFVMDAAEQLQDRRDIVFVIAGEGPEKTKLESRGLGNVIFLPLQPEARLNDLLNLADMHVLPQDKGTADLVLPSKIGGILASGKMLLAVADPGTELYKFLIDCAILLPTSDVHLLATNLLLYLDKRDYRAYADSSKAAARTLSFGGAMQIILDIVIVKSKMPSVQKNLNLL